MICQPFHDPWRISGSDAVLNLIKLQFFRIPHDVIGGIKFSYVRFQRQTGAARFAAIDFM